MQQIKPEIFFQDPSVSASLFLPEGEGKGALIVLPGGGYEVCAANEGAPVAARFAALGYAALLLNYPVRAGAPDRNNPHTVFPAPLRELARAVLHLRENAAAYGIDPARIALFGASAGGHLAAVYANSFHETAVYEAIAAPEKLRVNGCVLLYGATDASQSTSMLPAVFGHEAPYCAEELTRYHAAALVSTQTPPTVLFHSASDPIVPAAQSLDYFAALQRFGVASELHVFGCGGHAYGLGEALPLSGWPELADRFLRGVWDTPSLYDRFDIEVEMRARFHG